MTILYPVQTNPSLQNKANTHVFSTTETEPHEGKRKVESLWPIFRIHHQKTRYIFDLFYKRKAISRGNWPNFLLAFPA